MLKSIAAGLLLALAAHGQQYDLVIANGRVMDPATNLDAVRHVGIREGRIAAVSARPLQGKATVDAKGLVIAPGFIDLHSHGQTPENYRFKARDGVTTALEMEVGAYPIAEWYRAREGKALVNFGATVGHMPARMVAMKDSGTFLPRDQAVDRPATESELREMYASIRRGLDDGALGIGMGIAYVPLSSRSEILELFKIAAERKTAIFVHLRSAGPVVPGAIDTLQEVIADAVATAAKLHVVYITSTSLHETPLAIEIMDGAHKRGLDVTYEAYPYTA